MLEALGVDRPLLVAKVLIGVVRAFELETLTRPDLGTDTLRQRLAMTLAGI